MNKRVELLAPAGSYECFMSAVIQGADAVYIGGNHFGARAFAQNFTTEEILEAIDFAHIHRRKLFLTVNTLLKDEEIKNELYDYLLPLYERGLDAVIVQDIGVIRYIRKCFPNLAVHVSTQMTVTDLASVRYLEQLGVTRIVTARELSLDEVRSISSGTNLEIESFVHGALCYCYSGQCLFSSMIGGRSGNRGQCAQPCRLPYRIDKKTSEYPLSLKDICTLRLIPDLIEAGIYSFKIEGRMKSPVYVGSVIAMYRKYIDLYLEKGRDGFYVADEDIEHLMDVYNRGAFTDGYYNNRCGKEMVSLERPNHAGIPALKVQSSRDAVALRELHRGDTIEIPGKNISFSLNQDAKPGEKIALSAKYRISPKNIRFLYRTFNKKIADYYESELKNNKIKEKINGTMNLSVGKPAELCIDYADMHLEVEGDVVQRAVKSPLDEVQIRKQLSKMGQTEFVWKNLKISTDGNVFLPMQSLNEIRRKAIQHLQEMILESSCRHNAYKIEYPGQEKESAALIYTALVMKREQLDPVLECEEISDVYVDCNIIAHSLSSPQLAEIVTRVHGVGKAAFYVLPHIIRKDTAEHIRRGIPHLVSCGFDGVMVRNIEGYELLCESDYTGFILSDYSLYTFNRLSRENWKEEGIYRMTVPLELNQKEIDIRGFAGDEMVGYGYLPMMVSAQCIQKTGYGCTGKQTDHILTDRKNERFTVQNYCDYCYNVIYNSKPLFLLDKRQVLFSETAGAVRLQFTLESAAQTEDVLKNFRENLKGNTTEEFSGSFTRGHFSRGVK